jgi:hypothetical protein
MDGSSYDTYSYKLRSSGSVPVQPGKFLNQAFGAEKTKVTSWEATKTLPVSDNFIGANVDGIYSQASFQRLPYFTEAGDQLFQGTTYGRPEFINEIDIPGQTGW